MSDEIRTEIVQWVGVLPEVLTAFISLLEVVGVKLTPEQREELERLAKAKAHEEKAKLDQLVRGAQARLDAQEGKSDGTADVV
jgi:ribosome recycling factor